MDSFKRRQEGPQGSLSAPGAAHPALGSNGAVAQGGSPGVYGGPKRQRLSPSGLGGEGDEGAPMEGSQGPRVLPVCLLVSDNIAGALIGKGGATVRDLERSTGARIFVQRNALGPHELAAAKQAMLETVGPPPQDQALDVAKIVAIGGQKEEEVHAGLVKVLQLISSHPSHSGKSAALLLVPHRSVGGIVGQRGRAIEELSQKTQTQIRVVPGVAAASGDRALCITGQMDDHVAAAVQLVLQQLQQMLASGRLSKQDFDYLITISSTAQPKALRGPRGAMGALPGGPLPGGLPVGGASPAGPGGFFGVGGPSWGPTGGGGGPQGAPSPGVQGGSGYRFVASVESCGGLSCTSVLCFVIPQRLAAWVVGPQGSHVRAVREETGAQVQVLDEVSGFTGEDARALLRGPQGGGPSGGPSEGSDGGERFCMVSGPLQSVCGAVLRLGLPLQEKLQQQHQPLRLLIPSRFVSPLIGSKGTVIRDMQQKSGALIQISKTLGGPEGGSQGGPQGGAPTWGDQQQQQQQGPGSNNKMLSPREQHRVISFEGPSAPRLVALALVWQRILGVEYQELSRDGAPLICPSSLAEDLQQQGYDTSKIMLPPPPARIQQQQQQQQQFGAPEGGAPYYDGASPTGGAPWGPPQQDPMSGGQRPWGSPDDAAAAAAAAAGGWGPPSGPHDAGAPSMEQLEGFLRGFCARVGQVQDLGALGERQTIRLLLSVEQGEALLRRDSLSNGRYGGPPNAAAGAPNALDRISEVTGCHVRCFSSAQGPPNGGPQQQQMVLMFTGSPAANSIAVMLTQARLLQP